MIDELFVSKGIALAVPFGNREAIGQAIAHLLASSTAREHMGKLARAAHLSEYNYEHEFEPLMLTFFDGKGDAMEIRQAVGSTQKKGERT
jgi:hypothetical protein